MSENPNDNDSQTASADGEGAVRSAAPSGSRTEAVVPGPAQRAVADAPVFEPPESSQPSNPPLPLVARRVIKLTESSRPPRPTPVIESGEAYLEDLSDDLTDEEIRNLSPNTMGTRGAEPHIPSAGHVPSASSLGVDEPLLSASSGTSDEGLYTSASSFPPAGPPRPKSSLPPAGRAGPRTPTPPRRNKAPTPPPPKRNSEPPFSAPPASQTTAPKGAAAGAHFREASQADAAEVDRELVDSTTRAPSLSADFDDTTPIPISVDPPVGSPPPEALPPEARSAPEPDLLDRGPDSFEEVDTVEEFTEDAAVPEPEIPPADRKPPPPRRSAAPALPKVQKPRKKPWWETLFGDDFSRAYRPMTPSQLRREVDFVQKTLDLPPGSVILDLGCGQGEICVELARRGYSMVGYDLSVFQLAMAGDNAQNAHQKINFLQGDMREMAFEQMFDAVVCWDTSFGYFEEEKNVDILRRVKAALKPGGRLLLDILNRDFVAREAPYNHWFEGDGCVCMDDMSMDWITNRLKVKRSIILDDGRSKELLYSVRLYGLSDVGRMLHDVGFRVSAVSGDVCTPGAFFGPSSRRIIITANKP